MQLVNPKNGSVLQSAFLSDIDAHQALVRLINEQRGKANDFVLNIEAAYHSHIEHGRKFSDAQRFWLHKLATEYVNPKPIVQGVDLAPLRAMFELAAKHLKSPAVVLALADGREVRISRAGERSRNPGALYVAAPGFGGTYYGKLLGTTYLPSNDDPAVREPLHRLSSDPKGTATAHGKLTGKCCFCNSKLEDERSTEVGYGPVCAGHYGLDWGSKVRRRRPEVVAA